MRRMFVIWLAVVVSVVLLPTSVAAQPLEDCPSFERGVSVSLRKANGVYSRDYQMYLRRGQSVSTAKRYATSNAHMEFWRSLRVQTAAIVDYSTDPILFTDMYLVATARTIKDVGNAFGRAMNSCQADIKGAYPRKRVVS